MVRELVGLSTWTPGDLSQVRRPVTVLVGGRSAAADRARWQALADTLPSARVQMMPDEGHMATTSEVVRTGPGRSLNQSITSWRSGPNLARRSSPVASISVRVWIVRAWTTRPTALRARR